ncbi:MAG: RNA polymerase sigma factor [Flavobacteriaceae bacterium]|nr:RNA polymerase sigma factor [Flavobacteriaceae bacterium]
MTLTKQNIDSLLALCQDGNQLAQLEVYNRYQKAMFNTAFRIVKDTAEAEDIMQEAFITAFSKLDSFKGTATYGSWLKRIVINKSIVQYRKSQRFIQVSEENIADEADEDVEQANEEYKQIRTNQLLDCMNSLTDSYKNILSLHFIEGYDYEEICEVLGISYANCRTMISRAKDSLRKKLITV